MTTVSQIITDAYRKSNLVSIGTDPTTAQQTEALRYLNRLVKSVFGNEAGNQLTAFPLGSNNISRPGGYPWWGNEPSNDWFVPKNIRTILNLTSSINLYLHPDPDDGTRFALIDASNNLDTYPVTIYGNGRLFEGATTLGINTAGYDAEWFYRADLGNWQKYAPLATSDTFPFPEEFDNFFIIGLAMELNPSYGQTVDEQAQASFSRSRNQLRARYKQNVPQRSELALIRSPIVSSDRYLWGNSDWLYNPTSMFDKGWPW